MDSGGNEMSDFFSIGLGLTAILLVTSALVNVSELTLKDAQGNSFSFTNVGLSQFEGKDANQMAQDFNQLIREEVDKNTAAFASPTTTSIGIIDWLGIGYAAGVQFFGMLFNMMFGWKAGFDTIFYSLGVPLLSILPFSLFAFIEVYTIITFVLKFIGD